MGLCKTSNFSRSSLSLKLAIWNFAHVLTAVYITWWGFKVWMEWWCHTLELYWASHVRFFLSRLEIYSVWLERASPANQHPKNTIKKKKHMMLCTSWISRKMCDTRTCLFDYRINKPSAHSRCMICSSCSVVHALFSWSRRTTYSILTTIALK